MIAMHPMTMTLVLVALAGCRPSSPMPPAPGPDALPPTSRGDALFADGRCTAAIAAYSTALPNATAPDDVARLRLFRALARLDCRSTRSTRDAFIELRSVERDYPDRMWGRIARVFIDEVVREQALQQSLARSEAEAAQLTDRITTLERELLVSQTDVSEQKLALVSLRSERRKLQASLEQLTEQADAQRVRLKELEAELAGLKSIDMAREP